MSAPAQPIGKVVYAPLSESHIATLISLLNDMRMCVLIDNATAVDQKLPADVRMSLYTNALCATHWANMIESILADVMP